MRGILLVSHGLYAKEFKNSLAMITGIVTNVYDVCLLPEDGKEQFGEKLENLSKKLEVYDEIIVFADLMGGTPCNVATGYYMKDDRVSIIAGMNFAQVLTAMLDESISITDLVLTGQESILDVKEKLMSTNFDDEE
jgi:mannose/fructose-specific phosphotransferase system component IIA